MASSPDQVVRIFVSHSGEDNNFGIRLVKNLRRALGNDDAVWYGITTSLTTIQQQPREEEFPLLRTLTGHSSYVWSVAFSPDSQTLASGGKDNTIKLWEKL